MSDEIRAQHGDPAVGGGRGRRRRRDGGEHALYLANAGCCNVVLLERETLGSGSTSKAAGGIRAQFSDELNIRIGLECIRRYERFAEEPGGEIDFKQWGYLFVLTREEDVAAFRASVDLQQALGVPSRVLSAAEAATIVPGLRVDDVLAATFCPIDGYATPEAAVQGQQGPVVGEHIGLASLGLPTPFDLTPFSAERFATGAVRAELNVV